ncbi:hypothetical protein FFONT_0011 [Fervidicoccus fontis Kam940]|uniref:Uncharacterized protein n=1 Tax=Fervidicoccus fontis (strain DSM 19380 / JCM 18336 / VKM B-2539 / Kam940) TaxID=1163730 RepID=H9ZZ50_FERFK|nr:hypothetical protein FFONT_0011 [Fervidicoccus fontis Kam940]
MLFSTQVSITKNSSANLFKKHAAGGIKLFAVHAEARKRSRLEGMKRALESYFGTLKLTAADFSH